MYFVYILRCEGGTLYTGITTDIRRRFEEHSAKGAKGAKFTHSHTPEAVEALWSTENRSLASKLECKIKKLTRTRKLALIEDNSNLAAFFTDEFAASFMRESLRQHRTKS